MAVKDIFKVNRKTFFNPRAWLNYDALKQQTRLVYDIGRDVLTPETAPARKETFEEALVRLNLTEDDIKETSENYLFYSVLFLGCSLVVFAASFVMLFYYNTISGWLIALAITALLLTQAFRFNFWHFQIKYRKLGCTFEEWKRGKPFDQEEPPK